MAPHPPHIARRAAVTCALLAAGTARSVPANFLMQPEGNQRDVKWSTTESDRFRVYHDETFQSTGAKALDAAETAYDDLSFLLKVKLKGEDRTADEALAGPFLESRFERIPILVSTRTEAASFADFVTQNIEVNGQYGLTAPLYQHELSHRLMYERLDPLLGAGGRAFTLSLVPTWWIEGLPEYLTESIGRLEIEGVMRTMALQSAFLSWDRLHALYNATGDVFLRGYTTSGQFFKFLVEKIPQVSLAELHQDLFRRTLTPPFVDAVPSLLKQRFGKGGPALYEEFRAAAKERWNGVVKGMPPLRKQQIGPAQLSSAASPNVVFSGRDLLIASSLRAKPLESALFVQDMRNARSERRPLPFEGSGIWDLHPRDAEGGTLFTVVRESYPNKASGSLLRSVTFTGNVGRIGPESAHAPKDIPLGTATDSFQAAQVQAVGDGRAFVLGGRAGESTLLLVDSMKGGVQRIARWSSSAQVQILSSQSGLGGKPQEAPLRDCVTLIVEEELERTRLSRLCADGRREELLPEGKAYLRSGIVRHDGSILLLLGWNELLGFGILKDGVLEGIGPVPEWGTRLVAFPDPDEFGFWTYRGDSYQLLRLSLEALRTHTGAWSQSQPADSPWRQLPAWRAPVPPFRKLAAERRAVLLAARGKTSVAGSEARVASIPGIEAAPSIATPNADSPQSAPRASANPPRKPYVVKKGTAPYIHDHLFTYPAIAPPQLGGWSLGLVSRPWVEEMERDYVDLQAQYYFPTESFSGTASFISNRLFDGFVASAFSRDHFNGVHGAFDCTALVAPRTDGRRTYCATPEYRQGAYAYYSYTRQTGGSLSASFLFKPSTLSLGLRSSLYKSDYLSGSRSDRLGTMDALIATAGATASLQLWETAFYAAPRHATGGSFVTWSGRISVAQDFTKSIGVAKTALGTPTQGVQTYRIDTALVNQVAFGSTVWTLRSGIATTMGANGFLLREYYVPYRTYLLGSGAGLNGLNYRFFGDGRLFALNSGFWSYRNTLDLSFPIVSSLDTQFLILYLDNIRGEFVIGRGGVAKKRDFSDFENVNSASIAARMTIDIKGFQIFPSVAYGKILGAPGWSLFSELSFSSFVN